MTLQAACSFVVEAGSRAALYGSAFIIIVWSVCRVARRLSDATRCSLWLLTSIKLLVGIVITSSIGIPILPSSSGISDNLASSSTISGADRFMPRTTHHDPLQAVVSASVSQVRAQSEAVSVPHLQLTVPVTLVAIWAFVVVFRIGYLVRSLTVLRQCITRASPLNNPILLEIAENAAIEFGVKPPSLLVSNSVTDPLLCGLFRKVVVLSMHDVETLSAEEFRLVIAHEYAHLRRADLWLSLFPAAVQLLYWWLPPAWLVCSEFETSREAACDQLAVSKMNAEPGAYGRLLLKLSARPERLDPLSLAGALGVSSRSRLLKRRITMLQTGSLKPRRAATLASISVCAVIGLVPWRVVAATQINAVPVVSAAITMPAPSSDRNGNQYPLQPVNLDFTHGLAGWSRTEVHNNAQVSASNKDYTADVQPSGLRTGTDALVLSSVAAAPRGDVLVSQHLRPNAYRGKRIRLSAMVKTRNTTAASGIWIREDTTVGQRAWNEYSRAVVGSHDWSLHQYVLDVLPTCTLLEFGAMLGGTGTAEIADIRIEPTDASAATSEPDFNSILSDAPLNMNFTNGLRGWNESTHDGDEPYFKSGLDPNSKRSGVATPYLACNSDKEGVYGVLTQWMDASSYRGKRVRFSGYVKTSSIKEYGGLMMCINSGDGSERYDMQSIPQRGDRDWARVEYVADVAQDRTTFTIGINLQGRGTVWMDRLAFEVVGNDVPLTNASHHSDSLVPSPQNLSFANGLDHWGRSANGDGSPNPNYEVGISKENLDESKPFAYLKSSVPTPEGYGALRQDASPTQFLGKRIRFSASLKSDRIEKYSGLLLVVVRASGSRMWTMAKRPIVGTTKWTHYEYVVDIPNDCTMIMFGTSIQGRGTVYASDFKFEIVGKEAPVTKFDSKL